jgi:hypothetical protein
MTPHSFPDDLPWMIEYRCGGTVRTALPRRPVEAVSTSGDTNARIVCPTIPHGCTGWRLPGNLCWRKLESLPPHWLPFLNRERGTWLDPRRPLRP